MNGAQSTECRSYTRIEAHEIRENVKDEST